MSILDDRKRAAKGARSLVKLLTESTPHTFEADLDAYSEADGIIGPDFLQELEKAKECLPLLDDPENAGCILDLPYEFQLAMVELLIDREYHDALPLLAQKADDKHLVKYIKRRIHELKTGGVKFQKAKKKGGFKFTSVEEPLPDSLIAESNSMGEREIFYVAKGLRSGIRVLYVITNFSVGITDYRPMDTNRSGFNQMLRSMKAESGLEIFQVDHNVAYYYIHQSKILGEKTGKGIPPRFLTVFQDYAKPESPIQGHPVSKVIPPETVEQRFTDFMQSDSLHNHIEFRHWTLPMEELKKVETSLSDVTGGNLLVGTGSVDEQVDKVLVDAINSYFSLENRELWMSRIQNAAYLLWTRGLKEEATIAMTVVQALSQTDRPASSIPFCKELLGKLIKKPDKKAPEEPNDGGLIIP